MADQVTLFEVGPRDGLQNETVRIATADKINLVNGLSECGLRKIEVSSFVSPKWVPQLSDAAEVFAGIMRKEGVAYSALVPNLRGCEQAIASGVDEIAVFTSASETFSKRNINCSIGQSMDRFAPVLELARHYSLPVRGYVSCVTDCPYEGPIDPVAVAGIAERLLELGCYEVSLGDTIGKGRPKSVRKLLDTILPVIPANYLAGHFHDTDGYALQNIQECLDGDIRVFDTSIGGLGGCPYAPGSSGNVATETVARWLEDHNMETSVDLTKLSDLVRDVLGRMGKQVPSLDQRDGVN
jgi:hydroxymethylglutaryl-CoA lyase